MKKFVYSISGYLSMTTGSVSPGSGSFVGLDMTSPKPPTLIDGTGNVVVVEENKLIFKGADGQRFVLPDDLDKLRAKNGEFEKAFEDCFVLGRIGRELVVEKNKEELIE